jgi:hypothetical protein
MRSRVPWLFSLCLFACSPDGPSAPCSPTGPLPRSFLPYFAVQGTPFEVVLPASLSSCSAVQTTAGITVESRVVRTDGTDLPHPSATLDAGFGNLVASVVFTPDQPGLYSVQARIHPDHGQPGADVEVARNFRDAAGTALPAAKHPDCDFFQTLPNGDLLCQAGPLLTLFRGTAKLDTLEAFNFALGDDVLWTLDGSTVRRYLLAGGTFALTGGTPYVATTGAVVIPLGRDRAIVGEGKTYTVATWNGTTLTGQSRQSGITPGSSHRFAAAEGQVLAADTERACLSSVDRVEEPRCLAIGFGIPYGADAEGIWFGPPDNILRLIPVRGEGPPRSLSLLLPQGVRFVSNALPKNWELSPQMVLQQGGLVLASRSPEGIVLEHWGTLIPRTLTRAKVYGQRGESAPWSVFARP